MDTPTTTVSDQQILLYYNKRDPRVWELLYDKYAAVMFGIICRCTEDKQLAEAIFTKAFTQLQHKKSIVCTPLLPSLIRYSYRFASAELGWLPEGKRPTGIKYNVESCLANAQRFLQGKSLALAIAFSRWDIVVM